MLREYQKALAEKAKGILLELKIVYLAIEMRVGKTLIALETAKLLNCKSVLFVTKKKAIDSILGDYKREGYQFELTVTNYEQLHNFQNRKFDIILADEAHSLSAFPKPSLRTKLLRSIVKDSYLGLLSGTPTPESYSQIYHQFAVSEHSPFRYKNFYAWAKDFVDVKQKICQGLKINDYSKANQDMIEKVISKYFIRYTREEAGFKEAQVREEVITIPVDPRIHLLAKVILKDRYFKLKDGGEIVADHPAKLQTKLHQIYSGTILCEDETSRVLDLSKAKHIYSNYQNQKIAIFYKFRAERDALLQTFQDEITESVSEFKSANKRVYISQILSGSMGVDLSIADVLIFYNIDFSAVQYWQARSRLQTLDRTKPAIVHWIFSEGGIEEKVYKAVNKKKNYTYYYFSKDYDVKRKEITEKNNRPVAV